MPSVLNGSATRPCASTAIRPPLGGRGGLIAVDAQGRVALPFNTEGMYRGWARVAETPVCAIYADEADKTDESTGAAHDPR